MKNFRIEHISVTMFVLLSVKGVTTRDPLN